MTNCNNLVILLQAFDSVSYKKRQQNIQNKFCQLLFEFKRRDKLTPETSAIDLRVSQIKSFTFSLEIIPTRYFKEVFQSVILESID